MPKFDPNLIAAKTLRQCLQRHTRFERERHTKGKAYVDGLKGESAGGAALSGATTSADDLV